MIHILPSQTADTRTCDFANVTKDTLYASSTRHICDVGMALGYFSQMLVLAAQRHDTDKLTDIDGFHRDFVTGFKRTEWWDNHRRLNRHHLQQADGVMAGMARSGSVYELKLSPELLETAFQNTVEMLKREVVVMSADGL